MRRSLRTAWRETIVAIADPLYRSPSKKEDENKSAERRRKYIVESGENDIDELSTSSKKKAKLVDEEGDELSSLELFRLENIKKNKDLFESLGLENISSSVTLYNYKVERFFL